MVGARADEADRRSRAVVVVVGGGAIGADGQRAARVRVLRVPLGIGGGGHHDELERSDGARVLVDRLHVRVIARHVEHVDEAAARVAREQVHAGRARAHVLEPEHFVLVRNELDAPLQARQRGMRVARHRVHAK